MIKSQACIYTVLMYYDQYICESDFSRYYEDLINYVPRCDQKLTPTRDILLGRLSFFTWVFTTLQQRAVRE